MAKSRRTKLRLKLKSKSKSKSKSRSRSLKLQTKATPRPRRNRETLLSDLPNLSAFARTRRKSLGYTQQQLAFRSGLSLRFIREFELGKRTARLDKVIELLDFLGAELKVELRKPL